MATPARRPIDSVPPPYSLHASSSADLRLFGVGVACVDAILILFSGLAAMYVRFTFAMGFDVAGDSWRDAAFHHHLGVLGVFAALTILMSSRYGLYERNPGLGIVDQAFLLLKSNALASVLLTTLLYFAKATHISRLVIGVSAIVAFGAQLSWHTIKSELVRRQMIGGYGCRNVLIIGSGEVARRITHYLKANPQLGYKVSDFLNTSSSPQCDLLGRMSDLPSIFMTKFIDDVIITAPLCDNSIRRIAQHAQQHGVGIKIVPEWLDSIGWTGSAQQLGSFPVICLGERHIPATSLALKRAFDILFSFFALLFLSPLLLLIAVLIKIDSEGAVFYQSVRVSRRGKEFTCYKFRTMVADAEKRQNELEQFNERSAILFKMKNDPRVTRIGRCLRKFSLDELPQFWNVLKGDMSVVGPRPPIPSEVRRYGLEDLRRIEMTPGITGLWQVTARCSPSFQHYVQCDLKYTTNWSLSLDFKIILRTIPIVLRGTGE